MTAITASGSGFLGSGVSMVLEGLTIVRIRGELLVTLDSVSGAGSSLTGAFGIGLATAEAFAAGIASVPTPVSDDDWNGWMWHQHFAVRSAAGTLLGLIAEGARYQIDSKAMRKTKDSDVLFAAFEATEVVEAAVNVYLDSRMLVLLP